MLTFIKNFIFVFAVIDPLSAIPVFLEATKNFDKAVKKRVALYATLIASGVLLFFILMGQYIIEAMHVSIPAFQTAGGVILFIFAIYMIFGKNKIKEDKELLRSCSGITVFPIAIPSIASPGAILAVVLITDNNLYTFKEQMYTAWVVMSVMLVTYFLLLTARKIEKHLGEAGILIIEKIMGLLIASYAAQNILEGIKTFYTI